VCYAKVIPNSLFFIKYCLRRWDGKDYRFHVVKRGYNTSAEITTGRSHLREDSVGGIIMLRWMWVCRMD